MGRRERAAAFDREDAQAADSLVLALSTPCHEGPAARVCGRCADLPPIPPKD